MPLHRFPDSLRRYLIAFLVRWRLLIALRVLGFGVGLILLWTLAVCMTDRYAQLSGPVRWVCLSINGLILLGGIGLAVWRSLQPVDWNLAAAQIEARTHIFGERLQTVTSQLIADDGGRVSAVMLGQTVQQVETLLGDAPLRKLLPWRAALVPWAAAGAAALLIGLVAHVPRLQFDRLLARALFPNRPVDPVTMTHLQVWPGNVRVSQGETLTVAANVTGGQAAVAQSRGVDLYLSVDGKTWSRAAMNPTDLSATDSRFEFNIPAIDRDLRYFVHGGDADSEIYSIGVQRVPAVSEFRIRYDYPQYANHAPVNATNTDGTIEALTDSTATVTVVATEPLASAMWVLGRDRLPMVRTAKPNEWQVSFPVARSTNSALEMQSAAGVAGRGPSPMPVRAVPDEAPRAVVLQPTRDVRLESGDAMLVRIAASDDYGLRALDCRIRVNAHPVARVSIPVPTKPLRREGEFSLDLSSLGVSVGDVVTVTVEAEDEWRQSKFSDDRSALIAPVSVPPRVSDRATELRHAASLARVWHEDLTKARKALDTARGSDPKSNRQDVWLAAGRAMSVATDTASSVRQTLMRAIARTDSPALADALAAWIDLTELVLVDPARPVSPASRVDETLSNRLNTLLARTRDLAGQLDAVQQGERASVALLELKNLRVLAALPNVPATEPGEAAAVALRNSAVKGTKDWVDAWLREMGLSSATPNLENQLRQRIDHERDTYKGIRPPDLGTLAQEWVSRPARPSPTTEFPARLQAAAVVQALRFDGDLVRARDLDLAAKVAAALAQTPREADRPRQPGEKSPPKPRPPSSGPTLLQFQAAFVQILSGKNTDSARQRLQGVLAAAHGADTPDAAEPFALQASAQSSLGAYDLASTADAGLASEIARWSPEQSSRFAQASARSLAQLREIDVLLDEQADVQRVTTRADPDGDAADRQEKLAKLITDLRRPGDGLPTIAVASATEANVEFEKALQVTPIEPSPELSARRPLLAAAWHARGAADALNELDSADDPDVIALWQQAVQHQSQVVVYLRLASQHAVHREALRRLAEVPALAPVFQPTSAEGALASPLFGTFDRLGRDWFHPAATEKSSLPAPDSPAGKVQDQLQAYFNSISKAQRERK